MNICDAYQKFSKTARRSLVARLGWPRQPTYGKLVAALARSKPRIARALEMAEARRSQRLAGYLDGMRLRGLEQLHTYLDAAVESYASIPAVADLTFLVERVRADFETALEATLSGYQAVASDAMRDVMEIEGLLLDFAANPPNAQEWLQSDRRLRMQKYAPAKVRDRLKDAGVSPYSDEGFEPVDYRAHSEALHVTPRMPYILGRGPELDDDLSHMFADKGFIEMFEHGSRILVPLELLRYIALGRPAGHKPLTPLDDFGDAYDRTREMQVMLMAILEGPRVLDERLQREATTIELLEYLRDQLKANARVQVETDGSER